MAAVDAVDAVDAVGAVDIYVAVNICHDPASSLLPALMPSYELERFSFQPS